jgi:hypothetical protein
MTKHEIVLNSGEIYENILEILEWNDTYILRQKHNKKEITIPISSVRCIYTENRGGKSKK